MIVILLRRLRWIFPVIWMTVIFLLSHESAEGSAVRSGEVVNLLGGFGLDIVTFIVRKSAHLAAYAVLGALFFWALYGRGLGLKNTAAVSVVLSFVFAVSDEIHQSFIIGRSGEVRDVLIDTIGATLGVVLACLIASWLRGRRRCE